MRNRRNYFITLILLTAVLLTAERIKLNEEKYLMAVLWHQTSAEYRACCYQAYNTAKDYIDGLGEIKPNSAIVVDIDETVLQNSPYNAVNIRRKTKYPDDFNNWIDLAIAEPVPGSVEFLNYAYKKGINVFYISNRNVGQIDGTLRNLQKFGFPDASEDHILLREGRGKKQARRDIVSATHNIIMLIGDNIFDFADFNGARNQEERYSEIDKNRDKFGKEYIIIPNSMHGSWKKALIDYSKKLSSDERFNMYVENLKLFEVKSDKEKSE